MRTILVLGATGFTGTLVTHELARRGLPFILAGRSAERLAALNATLVPPVETRVARPDDPASLASALRDVHVVINTVGPFAELGEPVVRAAIDAGVHYLDTTGEAMFVKRMLDGHDAAARQREIAVVCAHSFEYALGDMACDLAVDAFGGTADAAEIVYAVRAQGVSRGTAKSLARMMGEPVLVWRRGELVPEPIGSRSTSLSVRGVRRPIEAISVGGTEALFARRFASVGEVRTFVSVLPRLQRTLRLFRWVLPAIRLRPVRVVVDRLADRGGEGPSDSDRTTSRFTVVARARIGGRERRCTITGADPYGITAVIIAEGAERLLAAPPRAVGVVSSAMAFESASFLTALGPAGLTWERT